ncbi:MAG: serine hydrolase [Candidatus Pacebacteria bacterium]|nr:serine hydrolase [Candidatus Paceibacterota bacterium]
MNRITTPETPTQLSVQEKLSKRASWIDEHIETKLFPGCAIAVHSNGDDGYLYGGRHDYGDGREYARDTLIDIASITKFEATSLMIHMLVDQGKISFDQRVIDFLPKYRGRHKDEVTIFHLMTNSVRPRDTKTQQTKIGAITGNEIIDLIMTSDLAYAPGDRYDYNNWNTAVLTLVIEAETGMPFAKAFKEMIAKPLGLVNTHFTPGPRVEVAPTEASSWRGSFPLLGEVHDETSWLIKRDTGRDIGIAGLFCNAEDLLTVGKALLQPGKLLSEEALDRLFSTRVNLKKGETGSFYGLGADRVNADYKCQCFADNTVFMNAFQSSIIMINRKEKLVFVQLSNAVFGGRKQNDKELEVMRVFRKKFIGEFFRCRECKKY